MSQDLNHMENRFLSYAKAKEIKENQRTNGPVNAHLRPEIYTNKLVLEW